MTDLVLHRQIVFLRTGFIIWTFAGLASFVLLVAGRMGALPEQGFNSLVVFFMALGIGLALAHGLNLLFGTLLDIRGPDTTSLSSAERGQQIAVFTWGQSVFYGLILWGWPLFLVMTTWNLLRETELAPLQTVAIGFVTWSVGGVLFGLAMRWLAGIAGKRS